MIYFFYDAQKNAVKIGWSKHDPSLRRRGLQTGNASALQLLGSIDGSMKQERHIHALLARWRIDERNNGREWFKFSAVVRRFVHDALNLGFSAAVIPLNDLAVSDDHFDVTAPPVHSFKIDATRSEVRRLMKAVDAHNQVMRCREVIRDFMRRKCEAAAADMQREFSRCQREQRASLNDDCAVWADRALASARDRFDILMQLDREISILNG